MFLVASSVVGELAFPVTERALFVSTPMETLSLFRIFRPQPMSAMRAATAAKELVGECLLWAELP